MKTVHYVGFTGDEYLRAKRIFGGPVMIHRRWDRRAQRDIGPDDVVIFARGDETQPLASHNSDDYDEAAFMPTPPSKSKKSSRL